MTHRPPDYYARLGLSQSASLDDISKAFRKLAKTCHPDLFPNDWLREQKFIEISQAYEVLSDPAAREAYDERLGRAAYEHSHRQQDHAAASAGAGAASTQGTASVSNQDMADLLAMYARKYRSEDEPESFTDFVVGLLYSPFTYCALAVIAMLVGFRLLIDSFVK